MEAQRYWETASLAEPRTGCRQWAYAGLSATATAPPMSRPVLVTGNKNYSSWSLRPWLLLRQAGVEFEEVGLLLDTPGFAAEVAPSFTHRQGAGEQPAPSRCLPLGCRRAERHRPGAGAVRLAGVAPVAARETATVAATDALCQPH